MVTPSVLELLIASLLLGFCHMHNVEYSEQPQRVVVANMSRNRPALLAWRDNHLQHSSLKERPLPSDLLSCLYY